MADRSRFGPRWDPDTDEVRDERPYDFGGAKRAIARGSRDQTAAADFVADCANKYAQAEHDYRVALAKEIVRLRNEDGLAWTTATDVARGEENVARLKKERDTAEGMKQAAEQLGWKATKDRASLEQLVDWSMKVAPLGERNQ